MENMRIFFYGIGRFYQRRRENLTKLRQGDTFLGFIDKRAAQCRTFDGAHVYLPEEALQEVFDAIVVTNASFGEIKNELLHHGVVEKKILSYDAYSAKKKGAEQREYGDFHGLSGRKLLMVTVNLNYDGGTLALVHAAEAMAVHGDCVTIMAPDADERLLQEILKLPVKVCLMPALRYLSVDQMQWIRKYDACLVNVYQNGAFAIKASKLCPTLWWLHEPSNQFCNFYSNINQEFPELQDVRRLSHLRIAAVSKRAQANFEAYYPGRVDTILPYCLPDSGQYFINEPHENVTFAIIGGVYKCKAQDVFLQSVALLPQQIREKAEFRIIGRSDGKDAFSAAVRKATAKEPRVRLCGVLNRVEMQEAFRTIDVVVCASREETMSLTITEGMMYGKICITTDATGMADYIKSGENGFVVPVENAAALAACMAHIIEQPERYKEMRKAARQTYEKYFTPTCFARRLTAELVQTAEAWEEARG